MIKKIFSKKVIGIIIIIVTIFISVFLVEKNKIENLSGASLSIVKKNKSIKELFKNTKYEVENFETIELYGTIMIPMNTVFKGIFGNLYIDDTNQQIEYESMKLDIDIEKNKIIVLQNGAENESNIDNSVEVEIEEQDGIRYVPIYLISNFPNVDVKIDGKVVYDDNKYLSSMDVFSNGKNFHEIRIITGSKEDNKNYDYVGQESGAIWREEALKRIEKYRKKDVDIIVKDSNGNLMKDAIVDISMINNEFKFGTAIRNFANGYEFNELFNIVGSENAFKWGEISQNGYIGAETITEYAKKKDMSVRGHCLWWDRPWCDELKELIGEKENPQVGTMAYIYEQYKNSNINSRQVDNLSFEIQQQLEQTILNHIEEEVKHFSNVDEWDVVNEILSQQYFKYWLYDRNFLEENSFLNKKDRWYYSLYKDNEQYYKFVAKCFDKVREINPKLKLVLNDDAINGDDSNIKLIDDIRAICNVVKYTNNIDVLGVQYHVGNNYKNSPQNYYNVINSILETTNIKEAAVTEYDNYISSKLGKYTSDEKKTKADYLRDTLISVYSNNNINEFVFWVYTCNHFEKEERVVYEELTNEWLHYKTTLSINDNGVYNTRLYKGDYTAKVKINNKEQIVNFKVSDNTESKIEIVIEKEKDKDENKVSELNNIVQENAKIKDKYNTVYSNSEILNKYTELIDYIDDYIYTLESKNIDDLDNVYKKQFELIDEIVQQYYSKKIGISSNILTNVLQDLINLSINYKTLYSYYSIGDKDNNEIGEQNLTNLINKYNDNLDVNVDIFTDFINKEKEVYEKSIRNDSEVEKYFSNQRAINVSKILSEIIDKEISIFKEEEKSKLQIDYDKDINVITNQDILVKLIYGKNTSILNNDGSDTYIFTDNGTFDFKVAIKDDIYLVTATVDNIDKDAPVISGIENRTDETQVATINVTDKNLDSIVVTKDGQVIDFNNGDTLFEVGNYVITAIDKAGNKNVAELRIIGYVESNSIYYISSNGIGDGTSEKNPMNINTASTLKYNAGDKILFKSGEKYNIDLNWSMNGSSNNLVTISSYGDGDFPIINGSIELVSNLAIYGLEFTNNRESCLITNQQYSENIYISNCVFGNVVGTSIYLNKQVSNIKIDNCIFRNCTGSGIAIKNDNKSLIVKDITISANIFSNMNNAISVSGDNLDEKFENVQIHDNYFINQSDGDDGVISFGNVLDSQFDIKLFNNMYYNFKKLYNIREDSIEDLKNNLVSDNNTFYAFLNSILIDKCKDFKELQNNYKLENNSKFVIMNENYQSNLVEDICNKSNDRGTIVLYLLETIRLANSNKAVQEINSENGIVVTSSGYEDFINRKIGAADELTLKNSQEKIEDSTVASEELPVAGLEKIAFGIVLIAIICFALSGTGYCKYKMQSNKFSE